MKLIKAYENAPEVGYIRGEQTARTYTMVVNRDVVNADKIDSSPLHVGEDAVVKVDVYDKDTGKVVSHIFVIGKVVAVESDTEVKVGVYRQAGQLITAPNTVIARFVPQSAFVIKADEPSYIEVQPFNTVLNPGTKVKRLTREFISVFMELFKDKKVFTPGLFLGSNVPIPFWLPHFGEGNNGIGEAYHVGIFGRTGSGKSALAKILMAYYGMHREMSAIVLDPQGEFYRDMTGQRGSGTYPLDVKRYWIKTGGQVVLAPISEIAFEDEGDIRSLLMATIHTIGKYIGITSEEKRERLVSATLPIFHAIALYLRGKDNQVSPTVVEEFTAIGSGDIGQMLRDAIHMARKGNFTHPAIEDLANIVLSRIDSRMDDIYDNESSRKEKRKNIENLREDSERFREFKESLAHLIAIIHGDRTIDELIKATIHDHTFLVLSMSDDGDMGEFLQYFMIDTFLKKLVSIASQMFKKGEHMNTMVFLDEAHRFVPSSRSDDKYIEMLRKRLIRAVRETRKYGLGWTFISQTLGSLSPDIVYQIRIFIIGYGLVLASERAKVAELVSGYPGAMDVYDSFPDPFSAKFFGRSFFPFMVVGPASPLSSSGAPLFFSSYSADKVRRSLDVLIEKDN